ncbi:MAG: glucokinase [Deltaproteobacteria bacterium]|nr:glucokinase [Deltaproteobacteria bacterium]
MMILAGDIGGTNCRFARFERGADGSLTLLESVVFATAEVRSFSEIFDHIARYSSGFSLKRAERVVVAVPGPVQKGAFAKLANLPWDADIRALEGKAPGVEFLLINDFVAQGHACRTSAVEAGLVIREAERALNETVAVIGAGTGLGHCASVPDGHGGFIVCPSEAGHAVFGFYGAEEKEYESFALAHSGRPFVSGDEVVSGPGLSLLHRFITGERLAPKEIAEKSGLESQTVRWFARFYARASRNYALSVLPFGGLYISGGVATKNPYLVDNEWFRAEFINSPAKRALLETIAVGLLRDQFSGLWGAADCC